MGSAPPQEQDQHTAFSTCTRQRTVTEREKRVAGLMQTRCDQDRFKSLDIQIRERRKSVRDSARTGQHHKELERHMSGHTVLLRPTAYTRRHKS